MDKRLRDDTAQPATAADAAAQMQAPPDVADAWAPVAERPDEPEGIVVDVTAVEEGERGHGLEFWQQQAEENLELAMRKQAELANYRKVVAKDMEYARRHAIERLLTDLFPVLDGLAQALRAYGDTPDGADPLVDGLRRTQRALEGALLKHGIEKISASGVPFDSELHQPLSVDESPTETEETVAEVYVDGYRLGDTVLKPAMVRVLRPA